MEQLYEFALFLGAWMTVMLVISVAGKRIARCLRSIGAWPAGAQVSERAALARARLAPARPDRSYRG